MANTMLSTFDNPYDPFTQWDEWLQFDLRSGHDTNALLGRVVAYSSELSESDQEIAIESAIDDIVQNDPELIYKKVKKSGRKD